MPAGRWRALVLGPARSSFGPCHRQDARPSRTGVGAGRSSPCRTVPARVGQWPTLCRIDARSVMAVATSRRLGSHLRASSVGGCNGRQVQGIPGASAAGDPDGRRTRRVARGRVHRRSGPCETVTSSLRPDCAPEPAQGARHNSAGTSPIGSCPDLPVGQCDPWSISDPFPLFSYRGGGENSVFGLSGDRICHGGVVKVRWWWPQRRTRLSSSVSPRSAQCRMWWRGTSLGGPVAAGEATVAVDHQGVPDRDGDGAGGRPRS